MSKKQAIQAISLLWLGSILGAGCAFLTQVILARMLGPADFGIFSSALASVTLLAPLAGFGISQFWLKAFGQEGWRAMSWLSGSFKFIGISAFSVLVALLAWALLGPHDAVTTLILAVLSLHILGQLAVELVSSKLQLEERYIGLALWQFLPHFLRLLSVALLAYALVELMMLRTVAYAYSVVSIGVFLVGTLLMWRMAQGKLALKGHDDSVLSAMSEIRQHSVKQVMLQSWPFGLAGMFYLICFQSDIILLKYISGDEAAGIYNVAFVIMAAVYMLPSVIYQKFLLPKVHRWANHDRKRFYRVYRKGNWVMLLLGMLSMLMIWMLAPWGVRLLFSNRYTDAVLPLGILALAAPIRFVATSVGATLVTQDYMQRKVYFMGFTALINISLNVVLIPIYGLIGAAIATVVSELILLFCYFRGAKLVFLRETETVK